MPLFYFDSHGGGLDAVSDSDGVSFTSMSEAKTHAMTLLPLVGVEPPLSEGEFRTWTVTIRNDEGALVCRYVMALINDKIGPAAVRHLRPVT